MNTEIARAAAQALLDCQWPEGTVASGMSCSEANIIAEFIADALDQDSATTFLQAHSMGDTEGDEHYEMGKKTRQFGIGWS